MKKRNGFTLVEILIVVVILGILAAIVVPQFSDASEDAKLSSLMSDLQTMRSQIQLYKIQHNGDLPTAGGLTFEAAMTTYTVQAGTAATTQAPADGVYGPYLQQIPDNQFCDANSVEEGTGTPGSGNYDWYYNTTTGTIHPDDDDHKDL